MVTGIHANFREQSGPVFVRTALSSSHALSCLHLLIASAIALAGMAKGSDPLGSRRAPTGDAAELSSPFTRGSVRYIWHAYYSIVKIYQIYNFNCCWVETIF